MTTTDDSQNLGLLRGLAYLHTDFWSQPFWDAAAEHRLVCQKCDSCGTYRMPPAAFCYVCRSQESSWPELPGTGVIYSYTSVGYATTSEIAPSDLPYVVAIIELDGAPGCRLVGNLVGAGSSEPKIGTPVEVYWDDAGNGVTVPRFTIQQQ
jgi:uncharacterized OB-fold protein